MANRMRLGRARRLVVGVVALAALSVGLVAVGAREADAATARVPVVFVHGYTESASMWAAARASFKASGYTDAELFSWNYNWAQSNATTASQLAAYVDQVRAKTGHSKVDIVNHSMGGINSRYYVKFSGGATKVRKWVSLAGANQGTTIASMCLIYASCREMYPGSSLLTKLNASPALPSGPSYYTMWSAGDGVIIPATNTIIPGATNIAVNPLLTHLVIPNDPIVLAQVKAILAA